MKKIVFTFSFLFVLGTFLFSHNAVNALTVSPAKLEISSDPGTILTGKVKLTNETNKKQTFYTSFENFEPSDDTGAPKFIGAEFGLATWMSSQESVTLDSLETTEVPFTVAIPADAEPGGYFASFFFGTQPPANEGGKVSIGGRLGILTLLRVNGDIPEDGGLLEYHTVDNTFFYTQLPVEFEYRFSNNGRDRISPRGDIEIRNTFGQVQSTFDANETKGSILPDSARRFNVTWGSDNLKSQDFFQKITYQWNHFHFGWYTAELNLGWGFTNQTANDSVSFFIIPWQLLLFVIIVLALVRILGRLGMRRYKASLMKQLQQETQQSQTSNEA